MQDLVIAFFGCSAAVALRADAVDFYELRRALQGLAATAVQE